MAFPRNLNAANPPDTESPGLGDDRMRTLTQDLLDLLGLPASTDISGALLECVAAGLKTIILQDAAANPATAGHVRRNAARVLFHDATSAKTFAWTSEVSEASPPGLIAPYGGATAPTGCLLGDGSVKVRAPYQAVFDVIGTAFNTGGEAGTDFRLPNFKGRFPVGRDAADTDFDVVGESGGAKTLPNHLHTGDAHTHTVPTRDATNTGLNLITVGDQGTTSGASAANTGNPTTSPLVMNPFQVVNYIIRT